MRIAAGRGPVPRTVLVALVVMLAASLALAGRPHVVMGDPGSAGGIPYAGSIPPTTPVTVSNKITVGVVLYSDRTPVIGAQVVIMHCGSEMVSGITTNSNGLFAVGLPDVSGLTLSLPMNGLLDVPIEAGEPILVILP
jgi:hypothetical protein